MTHILDSLLADYESGKINRRQLLQALALVAVPRAVQEAGSGVLRGRTLNHVNLQISNVDRSADFYCKLFELPPKRAIPDRPFAVDLPDGSFLSLQVSDRPGAIDHFCVGVDEFSPERVAAALKRAGLDRGLVLRPDSLYVRDPDNISVQISTPDWTG
jgi:catechol 2,3-dioxygenase-like lactoylglutathione lyase family enzyme